MNLDLRNGENDTSQRMLNAIEPGSVVPIHRHRNTSETVVCLRGKLVEELRDNPVAMSIICARVRSYLYNNHVPFNDRQKIINAVNLNPKDSGIMANKLQNKYRK